MTFRDKIEFLKSATITPEEQDRLAKISDNPCSCCGGVMSVGEDEAIGVCHHCYREAIKDME